MVVCSCCPAELLMSYFSRRFLVIIQYFYRLLVENIPDFLFTNIPICMTEEYLSLCTVDTSWRDLKSSGV
jgi:hypothetical protein